MRKFQTASGTRKTSRAEMAQVIGGRQLARGVPLESRAASAAGMPQPSSWTRINRRPPSRTSTGCRSRPVQAVLDQLLDRGRGPLDHLASGDLVGDFGSEDVIGMGELDHRAVGDRTSQRARFKAIVASRAAMRGANRPFVSPGQSLPARSRHRAKEGAILLIKHLGSPPPPPPQTHRTTSPPNPSSPQRNNRPPSCGRTPCTCGRFWRSRRRFRLRAGAT